MCVLEKSGIDPCHVEGIYPPSTMQEEMIFSTIMDPTGKSYIETYHFDTDEQIQPEELRTAIQAVASHHSALRVAVCWDMDATDDDDDPDSVLLAVLSPDRVGESNTLLGTHDSAAAHDTACHVNFQILGSGTVPWNGEWLWKVSLSPVWQGRQRISLSYHHSILDGFSSQKLLSLIQGRLKNPDDNHPRSDIFASLATLQPPPQQVLQRQLLESLRGVDPRTILTHDQAHGSRTGVGELTRRVSTSFAPRPESAAVPAWLARLALSVTLCCLQKNDECIFMEMTSNRRKLAPEHQEFLGLVLVPQIRRVQFHNDASLLEMARSLRTRDDLSHPFSVGELKRFLGSKTQNLEINLVCQTDKSFPSNGVGSWKWSHSEADVGLPLVVELWAPKDDTFQIKFRYHKCLFSESFINEFGEIFCMYIEWLQDVRHHLEKYNLRAAIDKARSC